MPSDGAVKKQFLVIYVKRIQERDLAIIHSQLDDITFENAYNTGRALTVEQAIALAQER